MLTYKKLFNNPGKLLRFTGLNPFQFETLTKRLEPLWIKAEQERLTRNSRKRSIGAGRKYHLSTIEDKLLLMLVFYRTAVTYEFLGWVFNLDASNVCRLIRRLTPLLEQAADPILLFALKDILKKRKKIRTWEEFVRKYPDLFELVIDSTEQKRKRPTNKRKQKNFYSGKKHTHSFKTQITVDRRGRIINVSRTYSGRIHDKTILIKEKTIDYLPPDLKKYLDKGYVKIQKLYPDHAIFIPTKRNRWKRTLTRSEKIKNTKISKKRIIIENVFSRMKKYSILSQTYRFNDKEYNRHFRNIASLCNFRLLFRGLDTS
jgi:hypothetical protein